jgi:hypothetical protein
MYLHMEMGASLRLRRRDRAIRLYLFCLWQKRIPLLSLARKKTVSINILLNTGLGLLTDSSLTGKNGVSHHLRLTILKNMLYHKLTF